jgi:hypothetical protein
MKPFREFDHEWAILCAKIGSRMTGEHVYLQPMGFDFYQLMRIDREGKEAKF